VYNNDLWLKLTGQNFGRSSRSVLEKNLRFGFRITKEQYFALVYIRSKAINHYCTLKKQGGDTF
jgi:hypothetical protein